VEVSVPREVCETHHVEETVHEEVVTTEHVGPAHIAIGGHPHPAGIV